MKHETCWSRCDIELNFMIQICCDVDGEYTSVSWIFIGMIVIAHSRVKLVSSKSVSWAQQQQSTRVRTWVFLLFLNDMTPDTDFEFIATSPLRLISSSPSAVFFIRAQWAPYAHPTFTVSLNSNEKFNPTISSQRHDDERTQKFIHDSLCSSFVSRNASHFTFYGALS